jgi:hypothetical protein
MRTRILALLAAVLTMMALATPAQAIKNGVADGEAHPYVGEIFFYVPSSTEDTRFTDPGTWYSCTGTLVSETIVVTAGHCTFDIGHDGVDGADTGGTDVWMSFAEKPDFSILEPSATFAPGDNAGRYDAWSTALNDSDEWIRATAYHHTQYDNDAFFAHDLGVLRLSEPVTLREYGELPTEGLLSDLYAANKQQPYTAVGYGLEGSGPKSKREFGGNTRRRAELMLVNLTGVGGVGRGTSAKFSSNTRTGGICFGDSGGPIFVSGTTTIVAVTSFTGNLNCAGTTGGYRIDQNDDLAFLATFGIFPPTS